MYTIEKIVEEINEPALTVPGSGFRFASKGRDALVWKSYATVRGVDCEIACVAFFEDGEWIDTRYPSDYEAAMRLGRGWSKYLDYDIKANIAEYEAAFA